MGRPGGSARPPPLLASALLALSLLSTGVCGLPHPLPRVFLSFEDLQASQAFEHYSISEKAMDYRILQMDEDQDRMYVGCKDHVLSMDINNITHGTLKVFWPASTSKIEECQMAGKDPTHGCGNFIRVVEPYNRTHLFMCGSGAYSPVCVYVNRGRRPEEQVFHIDSKSESGKGRCSFNPEVNTASVMINQELFSGMYIDFMGTDAAIFRSLTTRNAVRTDQHNSKWLSEPIFIDAHLIPDGTDPNDAKLYFFFRERLTDNSGNTKNIQTMVARVCPSDIGGQRSLVNKWTTFLKARMVCSVLEEDGTETHFDELENVFLLESDQPKGLMVFGVFTSTSSVFKGSAVCVYNMADILTVFNGPFAHREGPNFQWVAFQGRIPYPRPGTCPGGAFTPDIHTTKEFPDDVVTFVRNHPVMFNHIYPVGRRPLVVRTNADYKYTSVAVDQVMAADGNYQVLFLGTDKGTVQKVIVLPSNQSMQEDLILEELEVFKNRAPVTNLRISSKKQQLYVSSEFGVSQVSLHRCHAYGSACADCCLARDPYCAWDGLSCSRFYPTGKSLQKRSGDDAVRREKQHHLPGVFSQVPSGVHSLAHSQGQRQAERGEAERPRPLHGARPPHPLRPAVGPGPLLLPDHREQLQAHRRQDPPAGAERRHGERADGQAAVAVGLGRLVAPQGAAGGLQPGGEPGRAAVLQGEEAAAEPAAETAAASAAAGTPQGGPGQAEAPAGPEEEPQPARSPAGGVRCGGGGGGLERLEANAPSKPDLFFSSQLSSQAAELFLLFLA
uniref:Sema domain, immunoglobulin domain (Ig), short basic domain, secreted, (semaphorin) 3C n=1 Tax=Gasterosteus aculeatus aculeatus TaxID=481459 RepID=A0AAQ4QLP5_GASAC